MHHFYNSCSPRTINKIVIAKYANIKAIGGRFSDNGLYQEKNTYPLRVPAIFDNFSIVISKKLYYSIIYVTGTGQFTIRDGCNELLSLNPAGASVNNTCPFFESPNNSDNVST